LTSPARQNFTTNRPRRCCLSDEQGLWRSVWPRGQTSVPEPIRRYPRLRHGSTMPAPAARRRKVPPVGMPRGMISLWSGQVYSSRGGQFLGGGAEARRRKPTGEMLRAGSTARRQESTIRFLQRSRGWIVAYVASIAAASIRYRLSQVAPMPAQIDDCRAAIRFLPKKRQPIRLRRNEDRRLGIFRRLSLGRTTRNDRGRPGAGRRCTRPDGSRLASGSGGTSAGRAGEAQCGTIGDSATDLICDQGRPTLSDSVH